MHHNQPAILEYVAMKWLVFKKMVCECDLKISQLLETWLCFPKSCKANELKLEIIITCHPVLIIPSSLFSNGWMLTDLNGG